MDTTTFTDARTGVLVPIKGLSPDVGHAFVPSALPPNWKWPSELWPLLLEAWGCLSSLDGTGKHLPNPDILLRPIQQREARLSSQLEGTFTDPQKQALFQADPKYPTSVTDPTNEYREVFNYANALRIRLDKQDPANQVPLSKHLIRQLHQVLMEGVRSHHGAPGQFRTVQNQIGDPARFVPPPPEHLPGLLDNFETYLQSAERGLHPLVCAFVAHYQFEAIHPFGDGNGRVGRLLLALTIAEWCGLSRQWLYMSAFFERHKRQYMDLLLLISTSGRWDLWIKFCLEGVIAQAQDTEKRCERLLTLHQDFHERLKGRSGSLRLSTIVDGLFVSPVVTVVGVKNSLVVTYPTARADLKKLENLGIVQTVEGLPTITYYCASIFQVTHGEAA